MNNRFVFVALAIVGLVMTIGFFFLPWMSKPTGGIEALDLPGIDCVGSVGKDGVAVPDEITGLDMATTYGQLTYKKDDSFYNSDLKCVKMTGAWYLFWTPVVSILTGVLTGIFMLRKSYQRIYILYLGIGIVGLLIHLYVYFNIWVFPIESSVTGADVYEVETLIGYWISTLGWLLVLLAAVGLYFVQNDKNTPQITTDAEDVETQHGNTNELT